MGLLTALTIAFFSNHLTSEKAITTGFLGALTTFSTFQLELIHMFDHTTIYNFTTICCNKLCLWYFVMLRRYKTRWWFIMISIILVMIGGGFGAITKCHY